MESFRWRNFTLFLQNMDATCVSRLPTKRELTTKLHAVCTSDKFALKFHLSAGNCHDAPEGRKLIKQLNAEVAQYLLMDRAYEDDKTRAIVPKQGLLLVVPPKKNRESPWFYDSEIYKGRNDVEIFFFGSTVFAKLLLATTSLVLFIFLFFLWL